MKSVPSLSPHPNDVTGENTFVTSALPDIVTDCLMKLILRSNVWYNDSCVDSNLCRC